MTDAMNDTVEINCDTALELLERAVATRGPGFEYASRFGSTCVYVEMDPVEGGKVPACLLGVALSLLDVDINNLAELTGGISELAGYQFQDPEHLDSSRGLTVADPPEFYAEWDLNEVGDNGLADPIGAELHPDAVRVFAAAQDAQDGSETWGQALTKARRVADLLRAKP